MVGHRYSLLVCLFYYAINCSVVALTSTSSNTLRIVLIGKTGHGKSSTGNSLLYPRSAFRSMQSAQSITEDCQAERSQWIDNNGQSKEILVVDTPGFFHSDTGITNQMVEKRIASQIFEMTSPGVHAFLIVLRIGRFSPEEKNAIEFIRTIFGQDAAKYCIVVFTSEDQLEGQTVDDFISSSPHLQQLMNICNNRKLVINNKSSGQTLQRKTKQLLQIIQEMVNNNNGSYYTNEKYRQIEREREEERKKQQKEDQQRQQTIIDEAVRRSNEVVSVRKETRTVEVSRIETPIFATRRERRDDLFSQLFSIHGSGYKYHQVQIGSTTTINWREEQRDIKTLRNGSEQFGDWAVLRQWSTTN